MKLNFKGDSVLVTGAGSGIGGASKPSGELSPEEWRRVLCSNLTGTKDYVTQGQPHTLHHCQCCRV